MCLVQIQALFLLLTLSVTAVPRAVAPRGALDAEEQNNITVFKNVSPSVVNITAMGLERDFFSLNMQQVPQGTGTGFVWDAQGHIVTNFHVIQDASAARVTLADQSSYKAELVGAFPDRDLAVLRIQAPEAKLKPVPLGTSRDLLLQPLRCQRGHWLRHPGGRGQPHRAAPDPRRSHGAAGLGREHRAA